MKKQAAAINRAGSHSHRAQAALRGDNRRAFGERFLNIQRWEEMPRGGHSAAFEEPDLLAAELRAVFRPLRGE